MNKTAVALVCLLASQDLGAADPVYADYFTDNALRLDCVFGADSTSKFIGVSQLAKLPVWAGRRVNLDRVPYTGACQLTMIDSASGDTIYRQSYSSLYNEWLDLDDAGRKRPDVFENTFIMPYPKADAILEVKVLDKWHRPVARMKCNFDPSDELVSRKGFRLGGEVDVRYIRKSGDPGRCIDVAILSEGYTAAELPDFFADADTAVTAILSHEPFKGLADRFNFVAVGVPSVDSGVSVPRLSDWKDTAFSSNFSTFYSDRYLTTNHLFDVHDALAGVAYEHIIILANTEEYGGGGIYNSYTLTTAGHKDFKPVVVHEFGHSFGGLADEYFYENDCMEDTYPTDVEPWEPNVTTKVDFSGKWENLVEEGTAGLIEGGAYSAHGVWRPAVDCRMRSNAAPDFCPGCRQALRRLIEFYTE